MTWELKIIRLWGGIFLLFETFNRLNITRINVVETEFTEWTKRSEVEPDVILGSIGWNEAFQWAPIELQSLSRSNGGNDANVPVGRKNVDERLNASYRVLKEEKVIRENPKTDLMSNNSNGGSLTVWLEICNSRVIVDRAELLAPVDRCEPGEVRRQFPASKRWHIPNFRRVDVYTPYRWLKILRRFQICWGIINWIITLDGLSATAGDKYVSANHDNNARNDMQKLQLVLINRWT